MSSKHEYRMYTFTNRLYMRDIQLGIQSLHAVAEMFIKYPMGTAEHEKMHTWAKDDKTVIILDGGNAASLAEIFRSIGAFCDNAEIPYAVFYEDMDSLGGVITAVSVLVPAELYKAQREDLTDDWTYVSEDGTDVYYYPNNCEQSKFLTVLKSFRLA